MYRMMYNDQYLFDAFDSTRAVSDARLTNNVNAASYLDFTIYPGHPLYDVVEERSGTVRLWWDNEELFKGQIYKIDTSLEGSKTIACNSALEWLKDVQLRPYSTDEEECNEYEFPLDKAPDSLDAYFQWVIDQYNSKALDGRRFRVDVNQATLLTERNLIYFSSTSAETVADAIDNNIIGVYGGYLALRYDNDDLVLDYYADIHEMNEQIIDFGENILDITKAEDTTEQYTAVYPTGYSPQYTAEQQKYHDEKDAYDKRMEDRDTEQKAKIVQLKKEEEAEQNRIDGMAKGTAKTNAQNALKARKEQRQNQEKAFQEETERLRAEQQVKDDKNSEDKTKTNPITIASLPDIGYDDDLDIVKKGDVVYSVSAVERYGYKEYAYAESDIEDQKTLLKMAVAKLKTLMAPQLTVDVRAVDQALYNPQHTHLFVGQAVRVRAPIQHVDEYMMVSSIELDLNDPSQTTATLGVAYDTLTGQQSSYLKNLNSQINASVDLVGKLDENIKTTEVTIGRVENLTSTIKENQDILVNVAEDNRWVGSAALENANNAQETADAAVTEVSSVKDTLGELKENTVKDIESIRGDISSVTDDLDATKDKLDDIQTSTDAAVADIRKDVSAVEAKADQADAKVSTALENIDQLDAKVTSNTTAITNAQGDILGVQRSISAVSETANSALGVATTNTQTLKEQSNRIDTAYSDIEGTRTSINEVKQTADGLKVDLETNYLDKDDISEAYATKAQLSIESDKITTEVGKTYATIASVDALKNIADNAIETWTGQQVPTASNPPASTWTTDELKKQHSGDIYYDMSTGKSYRWGSTDGKVYSWSMISDNEITKALAQAAKAQETADGAKQDVVNLSNDVKATYATNSKLEQTADAIKASVTEVAGTADALAKRTAALETKSDSITATVKSQGDTLAGHTTSIGQLQVKADSITSDISRLDKDLEAALSNSEELVYNGGFELLGEGWTTTGSNIPTVNATTSGPHSGKTNFSFSLNNASQLISTKPIEVTTGQRYRFGLWYKWTDTPTSGTFGGLRLWGSSDGSSYTDIGRRDIPLTKTDTWNYVSLEWVATSSIKYIRARFAFDRAVSIVVDDVSIKDVTDVYKAQTDATSAISQASKAQQDLDGFKQTVSETYTTKAALTEEMKRTALSYETRNIGMLNQNYDWCKLGTLTIPQQGKDCIFDLIYGTGYNGKTEQQQEVQWVIRSSNGSGSLFSLVRTNILGGNGLELVARYTSATSVDIYVRTKGFQYVTGTYTVMGQYTKWEHLDQRLTLDTYPGTEVPQSSQKLANTSYVNQTAREISMGVVEEYENLTGNDDKKIVTQSNLTITKDQITAKVEETYQELKDTTGSGTNGCANPDFETGDMTGWTGLDGNGWFVTDADGAYQGKYCAKTTNWQTSDNSVTYPLYNLAGCNIVTGHTYRITYWIKSSRPNNTNWAYHASYQYNPTTNRWTAYLQSVNGSTYTVMASGWNKVTYNVTPGSVALTKITPYIYAKSGRNDGGSGAMWVDNVSIEDITEITDIRTTTSTRFSEVNQRIDGIDSTVSNKITQAVNDIAIGGTNLLLDTRKFGQANPNNLSEPCGKMINSRAMTVTGTVNGFTYRELPSSNTGTNIDGAEWLIGPVEPGETYTLSFWAKGDVKFWTYFYGPSGYIRVDTGVASTGDAFSDRGDGNYQWTPTNEWQRYWITWTLTTSTNSTELRKRVLFRRTGNTGSFAVYGVKLERGNKATEWSASPFDFLDGQDVKNTYTDKTTFNTTIAETQSKITQAEDRVTTKVTSTERYLRNACVNHSFETGDWTGWPTHANCIRQTNSVYAHTGSRYLDISSSSIGVFGELINAGEVKAYAGHTYTISCWLRAHKSGDKTGISAAFYHRWQEKVNGSWVTCSDPKVDKESLPLDNTYREYSFDFTLQNANATAVRFRIIFEQSGVVNNLAIDDVMLWDATPGGDSLSGTYATNSAIDVAKDSITSTVASTYATKDSLDTAKSEWKQTADGFTATISSNSDNMWPNPYADPTKVDFRAAGATGTSCIVTDKNPPNGGNVWQFSRRDHIGRYNGWEATGSGFTILPNRTYRITALTKRAAGSVALSAGLWNTDDNKASAYPLPISDVQESTGWYKKTWEVTTGTTIPYRHAVPFFQIEQSSNGTGGTTWLVTNVTFTDVTDSKKLGTDLDATKADVSHLDTMIKETSDGIRVGKANSSGQYVNYSTLMNANRGSFDILDNKSNVVTSFSSYANGMNFDASKTFINSQPADAGMALATRNDGAQRIPFTDGCMPFIMKYQEATGGQRQYSVERRFTDDKYIGGKGMVIPYTGWYMVGGTADFRNDHGSGKDISTKYSKLTTTGDPNVASDWIDLYNGDTTRVIWSGDSGATTQYFRTLLPPIFVYLTAGETIAWRIAMDGLDATKIAIGSNIKLIVNKLPFGIIHNEFDDIELNRLNYSVNFDFSNNTSRWDIATQANAVNPGTSTKPSASVVSDVVRSDGGRSLKLPFNKNWDFRAFNGNTLPTPYKNQMIRLSCWVRNDTNGMMYVSFIQRTQSNGTWSDAQAMSDYFGATIPPIPNDKQWHKISMVQKNTTGSTLTTQYGFITGYPMASSGLTIPSSGNVFITDFGTFDITDKY